MNTAHSPAVRPIRRAAHPATAAPSLALALALAVPAAGPCRAAVVEAASKISAVTVYPDRAWVTRTAKPALAAGETSLVFPGLPAGLDTDSVSASVRAGGARILGLEIERQHLERPRDERLRALQKELETLNDRLREAQHRIETERKMAEWADKITIHQADKVSKDLPYRDVKPADWDAVLGFLGRYRNERFSGAIKAESDARDLTRAIQAKQAELANLSSSLPTQSLTAAVRLSAKAAGEAAVDLRYVVMGAGWEPSYDARADSRTKEVDLTYYGTVRQRTGEEWKDVRMSLSTARPGAGAHLAQLQPIYLSAGAVMGALRQEGERNHRMRARNKLAKEYVLPGRPLRTAVSEAADEMMAAEAAGPPEPDADAGGWETAEAPSGGPAVLYQLAGEHSVPSGDRPQRVTISASRFSGEMSYEAAPKLQPYAYLKSSARNVTPHHLLAGPVNVFLQGNYIGQSRLPAVAPQQEFQLHLGPDERLKAKREPLVDKTRDSFWGKKLVLAQSFRITLENYTGAPQSLRVHDQMPVSREAGIEVRRFDADPSPTETRPEKGALRWDLVLKPGEKKTLEFGYEVVFPEEISQQPGARENILMQQKAY